MDPFAPAWLRIPAPPVPASSSSHQQDQHPSSSSSFSFRSAYSGIAPVNGSPVRSYERSSPDQQQQPPASSRMQPHAVPIRTSSLDDDHSPLVDQHAAAGQWKHGHYHQQQQYTGSGMTTGDRMRGKAASVSESSRQRFSHNNNNMTPAAVAVTSKTTTTGTGTSGCSAAAAAVPDFRELASFQFHTRSGSFGSEAVNGSSGSSGSGASSTDPCSSEDDISILTAAAASSHSVRFPATAAASGRMAAANNTVTTAAAPATSSFNREFPSLAPAAEIGSSKVSSSVWDSSAKLKVMGGGMKKLWVKSNVNGKDAPLAAGQQQSATNNKLTSSSFFTGKKAAVATPAMEILVKHPKTKITSSRSDFFKSLRSSSSSTGTSTAASHSNPISPPAVAADGVKQGDCGSPSLSDEVFRRDSKDEGKVGSKDDASGKVFHEQDSQEQEQEQELDMGWIGRSADSILSSSLEAEQRLLKEMGWKEEEDDFYEPLTEDEVREFRDLIVARKSQASESCGSTITDIMTCSKNIKNAYGSMGKNVINFSSWSGAGKKCINSSLASPPEFQQHAAPSSSSSDDSSDDEDENAAAPVPRFHHTCS